MSNHPTRAKRQRNIPKRQVVRPAPSTALPAPMFRQSLPVRFKKLPDGRAVLVDTPIRLTDLATAPRQLWNKTVKWIGYLLHLDNVACTLRVLVGWFRAAVAAFKPVLSDTDWHVDVPTFESHGAVYGSYIGHDNRLRYGSEYPDVQKRIVVIEKYIVHDNGVRRMAVTV